MTQTYPRFDGDTAGPFIRDLARGLVAEGDSVTVLTPHTSGVRETWREDGVEAWSFRYAPASFEVLGYGRSLSKDEAIRWRAGAVTPFYTLAARRALKSLVGRGTFDLVHAHWVVPNGVIASATNLGVPLAVGLHGSDVFLAEKAGVRRLVRWALGHTQILTGCSPELVQRVCAIGFDSDRSHVIPYGVDVNQFSPDPGQRQIWRDKLSIPQDAVVMLGVGRMVTKKGFHVLLDQIPGVLKRYPDSHFVFGGDGDRLQEFREQTASYADRVHFPGIVLRDTLPDLYRCADLFVLPAVHDKQGNVDGLPNVILEGMASGLPIVASGISGIPLAVTDQREGFLTAENDGPGVSEALGRLLGSPDLRHRMGRAARVKAEEQLTWRAVARRYRRAYESALD